MSQFTIRVYFLLRDESGLCLLLSDERIGEGEFTKFPGGGLEWGEGPVECALREAREELGQDIEVTSHFYTTDFFVESQFHPRTQVISIYYNARLIGPQIFQTTERPFGFVNIEGREESFRWVEISKLKDADLDFPIDRVVVRKLLTL